MTNLFSDGDQEKSMEKLCPFIGNMASPVMRESKIAQAGMPQIVGLEAKLFPCQGALCTFWDGTGCNISKGIETLIRLEKALAPLAKFMGA